MPSWTDEEMRSYQEKRKSPLSSSHLEGVPNSELENLQDFLDRRNIKIHSDLEDAALQTPFTPDETKIINLIINALREHDANHHPTNLHSALYTKNLAQKLAENSNIPAPYRAHFLHAAAKVESRRRNDSEAFQLNEQAILLSPSDPSLLVWKGSFWPSLDVPTLTSSDASACFKKALTLIESGDSLPPWCDKQALKAKCHYGFFNLQKKEKGYVDTTHLISAWDEIKNHHGAVGLKLHFDIAKDIYVHAHELDPRHVNEVSEMIPKKTKKMERMASIDPDFARNAAEVYYVTGLHYKDNKNNNSELSKQHFLDAHSLASSLTDGHLKSSISLRLAKHPQYASDDKRHMFAQEALRNALRVEDRLLRRYLHAEALNQMGQYFSQHNLTIPRGDSDFGKFQEFNELNAGSGNITFKRTTKERNKVDILNSRGKRIQQINISGNRFGEFVGRRLTALEQSNAENALKCFRKSYALLNYIDKPDDNHDFAMVFSLMGMFQAYREIRDTAQSPDVNYELWENQSITYNKARRIYESRKSYEAFQNDPNFKINFNHQNDHYTTQLTIPLKEKMKHDKPELSQSKLSLSNSINEHYPPNFAQPFMKTNLYDVYHVNDRNGIKYFHISRQTERAEKKYDQKVFKELLQDTLESERKKSPGSPIPRCARAAAYKPDKESYSNVRFVNVDNVFGAVLVDPENSEWRYFDISKQDSIPSNATWVDLSVNGKLMPHKKLQNKNIVTNEIENMIETLSQKNPAQNLIFKNLEKHALGHKHSGTFVQLSEQWGAVHTGKGNWVHFSLLSSRQIPASGTQVNLSPNGALEIPQHSAERKKIVHE